MYVYAYNEVFWRVCKLTSGGRKPFLALSAMGHATGPRVHYGANLGPGRAPRRVLWASGVVRAGSFSRGLLSAPSSHAGPWKTHNRNFSRVITGDEARVGRTVGFL